MNKQVIYLTLFLAICASCKKNLSVYPDDPPVPTELEPTQSGNDILVCKVNGKRRTFSGRTSMFRHQGVDADLVTDLARPEIYVSAIQREKGNHDLGFLAFADSIELNKPTRMLKRGKYIYDSYYYDDWNNYYYTDDHSSTITFTRFDSLVVAGTFEFHGWKGDSAVHITEGWFDIKLEE